MRDHWKVILVMVSIAATVLLFVGYSDWRYFSYETALPI